MKLGFNRFIFVLSFFLIWLFSRSLLQDDFFFMHDYTHPQRLVEMYKSLSTGQFPPIWSQNFGFGYGMPLFLFYGPLPYFIGCIFMLLGISAVQTTQWLFILSNIVAFIGAYKLNARWGRASALIAATLLLAAPYRALDIYVRGALNEVVAIGILPWILHFGLQTREKKSLISSAGLALSVAALILTHNLTALFSLPIIALFFAIVFLGTKSSLHSWGQLILGAIWGVILSVFYAVPAFVEKNETAIDSILGGYFDYRLHFLYIRQWFLERWAYGGSEFGPNDGMSFHLGVPALILSVLTVLFTLQKILHHRRYHLSPILLWLQSWKKQVPLRLWVTGAASLCLTLTLFLTLNHSAFVWESVPLLNFVQFPWRLLGLAAVFLSLLGGLALSHISFAPARWFIFVMSLLVISTQSRFHRPDAPLSKDSGHFTTDEKMIRVRVSEILPDYIPRDLNQGLPPVDPEQRIVTLDDSSLRWEMNDPHQLLAYTNKTEPTQITWNIADFPGWEYFVNGEKVAPTKTPDGIMTYTAEQPVESIGAQLTPAPLRTGTLIISFLGLLALSPLIPMKKQHDEF